MREEGSTKDLWERGSAEICGDTTGLTRNPWHYVNFGGGWSYVSWFWYQWDICNRHSGDRKRQIVIVPSRKRCRKEYPVNERKLIAAIPARFGRKGATWGRKEPLRGQESRWCRWWPVNDRQLASVAQRNHKWYISRGRHSHRRTALMHSGTFLRSAHEGGDNVPWAAAKYLDFWRDIPGGSRANKDSWYHDWLTELRFRRYCYGERLPLRMQQLKLKYYKENVEEFPEHKAMNATVETRDPARRKLIWLGIRLVETNHGASRRLEMKLPGARRCLILVSSPVSENPGKWRGYPISLVSN